MPTPPPPRRSRPLWSRFMGMLVMSRDRADELEAELVTLAVRLSELEAELARNVEQVLEREHRAREDDAVAAFRDGLNLPPAALPDAPAALPDVLPCGCRIAAPDPACGWYGDVARFVTREDDARRGKHW